MQHEITRGSRLQMFYEIGILENSQNSLRNF